MLMRRQIRQNHRRLSFSMIGSFLILGAVIYLGLNPAEIRSLYDIPLVSWFFSGFGVLFIWLGIKE